MRKLSLAVFVMIVLGGCAPKVGSDAWCKALDQKPKGDWTANEATDYAKYCVLGMKPAE